MADEYDMFQVSGPSFCAGIIFRNGRLFRRAPILKVAPVVTLACLHDYVQKRGWAMRWVSSWKEDRMRVSRELQERILADSAKTKEQKQGTKATDLLRAKIEQLLRQGVSRQWIARYLDCPIKTVNAVTKTWKQTELPKILRERANEPGT